jgi:hypothetical protein
LQDSALTLPADRNLDWTVRVQPELVMSPTNYSQFAALQSQLSDGVCRHFAKPFALYDNAYPDQRWPSPEVNYARFWSIPARMYCLGSISPSVIEPAVVSIPVPQ